jgi:DHA1 family tetracycline resistance protein-like MFS transporter
VGFVFLMKMRPIPLQAPGASKPRAKVSEIMAYRSARNFLFVALLANIAVNAPGPLITLQMVRVLNATNVEYGWYLAIFWVSVAVFGLFTPWLVERFGNTLVFAAACIGLAVQLVILALAPSLPVTWIAGFVGGVTVVMFQVTSYALMVQCAPPDKYEGYVGLYTTSVNFAVFAGPFAITALVGAGMPISTGLLICAVARALAGVFAVRATAQSGPAPSSAMS